MIFGIVIIFFLIFSRSSFSFSSNSARRAALAATSAFFASASSFLPCPIKAPISLDILFLLARISSASCCAFLTSASNSITSSTRGSLLSWNFFLIFSLTTSGFSLKNLMSIIMCLQFIILFVYSFVLLLQKHILFIVF